MIPPIPPIPQNAVYPEVCGKGAGRREKLRRRRSGESEARGGLSAKLSGFMRGFDTRTKSVQSCVA